MISSLLCWNEEKNDVVPMKYKIVARIVSQKWVIKDIIVPEALLVVSWDASTYGKDMVTRRDVVFMRCGDGVPRLMQLRQNGCRHTGRRRVDRRELYRPGIPLSRGVQDW